MAHRIRKQPPSLPRSLAGRGKRQCHLHARLSCFEHPQKCLQERGNPGSFCRQRCRGPGELGELAGAGGASQRAAYRSRNLELGDAKGRRRNNCLVSLVSVYPGGGGPHERTTCNLISGSYRVNGARFCSGARAPMRRGREAYRWRFASYGNGKWFRYVWLDGWLAGGPDMWSDTRVSGVR